MIGWVRNSVRAKLVLLFFTITAAAVGFVYLYVVPQLSSSLTAERLERLEMVGDSQAGRLETAATAPDAGDPVALDRLARRLSATAEARVTLLGVEDRQPAFVLADSESAAEAALQRYPAATGALLSGSIRSGVVGRRGGGEVGETAVPVDGDRQAAGAPGPVWIAVYSTPLDDVEDNVALIRRQILIAGGIALVAALLAAWFAAGAHARRLRRLESAAVEVAGGNFAVPIPIDSGDEVGQLATTFDGMQGRLAQLDSARREFIANASHELRTPVASLGGFVELLEDDEPDAETRAEFVRTMREQVDRLTKLTTDLLDLSKIDAGALALSSGPVDLVAIGSEAAEEFAAIAAGAGASIRLQVPEGSKPLAQADYGRTMQIMRILIDNAIKHTGKGTEITISTDTDAGSASISVADDGPGIDRVEHELIFERFHTADPAGGSGLGLAISRELARRMGGELALRSRRGRTEFTLSLPAAREVGA